MKNDRSFDCQQLLNPTPKSGQSLNPDYLHKVEKSFLPKRLFKFMVMDQAGIRSLTRRVPGMHGR